MAHTLDCIDANQFFPQYYKCYYITREELGKKSTEQGRHA